MKATRHTRGSKLLGEWLSRTSTSRTRLAADCLVSEASITFWMRGQALPTIPNALRLEALTGVPLVSWAEPA